ncbi:hypothetical protein NESM_000445600 [Novymonas esmeraldas]|uniref:Trichohyalin-plectin-homology domain-containing protein n=1 Tax=Novymonas esmeraldas TaxID=1808958 RepID=A0AAW0EPT2_9TRYP
MPPPRGPGVAASSASSSMAVTRARRDPLRRIGNGNAVASGLDMTRVGILSDRELAFFHRLAYAGSQAAEQQEHDARKQEEDRRRGLSKARTATWTDTIEARHDRFVQAQQDAKDAAEARQKVLDELYAEKLREEHQAILARQEMEELKEDPRGRNMRSMQLLHETLKAREEQLVYKDMLKKEEAAQNADAQRELQLRLWGDQAEKLQKALAVRQRNVEEKNANLETVLYQLEQRRQGRAEERADGVRVAGEAAEERAEQAEEDAQRRRRELENGAYNIAHSRTALTKSQKLQARVAETAKDEVVLHAEEAKVDAIKRWVTEHQEKKQAALEQRKAAGLQQYLDEATRENLPTYRTQDVFEQKGYSMLQRLSDGDAERRERQHDVRLEMELHRRAVEEERAAEERGEALASSSSGGGGGGAPRHRAATTAAGFLNKAEEKAYAEEMRGYPAQVRAQEAAEAAARRAEAVRVAHIQELQAAEKRENARRAVEARRDEARQQQAQQKADDARYRTYIDSVVPADMHPVLYRKATQLS